MHDETIWSLDHVADLRGWAGEIIDLQKRDIVDRLFTRIDARIAPVFRVCVRRLCIRAPMASP